MRSIRLLVALALGIAGIAAAAPREGRADVFSPDAYYRLRMDLFAATPLGAGDIVFLGDSITEGAEWNELFPDLPVRDRGISGDTTAGVLARLDTVTASRPAAVFLLIGTNELAPSLDPAPSLARQREILERIRRESPDTRVFVQSLLPRAAAFRERDRKLQRCLARHLPRGGSRLHRSLSGLPRARRLAARRAHLRRAAPQRRGLPSLARIAAPVPASRGSGFSRTLRPARVRMNADPQVYFVRMKADVRGAAVIILPHERIRARYPGAAVPSRLREGLRRGDHRQSRAARASRRGVAPRRAPGWWRCARAGTRTRARRWPGSASMSWSSRATGSRAGCSRTCRSAIASRRCWRRRARSGRSRAAGCSTSIRRRGARSASCAPGCRRASRERWWRSNCSQGARPCGCTCCSSRAAGPSSGSRRWPTARAGRWASRACACRGHRAARRPSWKRHCSGSWVTRPSGCCAAA